MKEKILLMWRLPFVLIIVLLFVLRVLIDVLRIAASWPLSGRPDGIIRQFKRDYL